MKVINITIANSIMIDKVNVLILLHKTYISILCEFCINIHKFIKIIYFSFTLLA